MKRTTIISAIIFGTTFGQTALAQLNTQFTQEDLDYFKAGYRYISTSQLSIETSLLLVSASWHCGSTIATQIYNDLNEGKEPSLGTESRECRIDSIKLKFAIEEATARAKKQLQKHDIIETPNIPSSFQIAFGQMTPLKKVESTGSGFCLEQARMILQEWETSEKFPLSFNELKNNSVTSCQIWRRGDETIGHFNCQNWLVSSNYNFETGEIKMFGYTDRRQTEAEKRALRAMVQRDQSGAAKTEDLSKWLRADLESGIHFTPVITLQKGAATASIEVRGVAGPDWQFGRYTENGVGRLDISKLPAKCSVKTEVPATSTEPRPGRVF